MYELSRPPIVTKSNLTFADGIVTPTESYVVPILTQQMEINEVPEQLILDRVRRGWDWERAVIMRVDCTPDVESEADTPADDPPVMATPVAAEE